MTDTVKKPNINHNLVADFFYLILDYPTNAVMASTKNHDAAQALQLFSRRLIVRSFETHKNWLNDDFKVTDFNNINEHYAANIRGRNRELVKLDESIVTPEFVEKRKEIIRRLNFQDSLATRVDLMMQLTSDSRIFQNYASTIGYELEKCRPEENFYTPAVIAYGIASECNSSIAYNELKLQMDNLAHIRMRSLGIYTKYRNRLNQAPGDADSLREVVNDAMQEIIRNTEI